MPDITKALVVFAVILLVYFVYIYYSNKDINKDSGENFLGKIKNYIPEPFADVSADSLSTASTSTVNASDSNESKQIQKSQPVEVINSDSKDADAKPAVAQNDSTIKQKFINRNSSENGHKAMNYADGERGNFGKSEWMQYFDQVSDLSNNVDKYKNDNFQPNEAPNNAQAMHRLYNKKGLEKPEDLFDVDKFLPKDIRDDWFEVMPEPISVKNRHLINITRPIGVNTIGTSLRNPSHDIRGAPPCPKFVVSPWLQSSIEPDINIKPII